MMRLSRSTEYAIRILHYLYNYEDKDELVTAHMLAQATGITYPVTIKIANQLLGKGHIKSVQGRRGGYRIAKRDGDISIYDVVLAVEGDIQISPTPGIEARCSMQSYFNQVQKVVVDTLSSQYVADFAAIQY